MLARRSFLFLQHGAFFIRLNIFFRAQVSTSCALALRSSSIEIKITPALLAVLLYEHNVQDVFNVLMNSGFDACESDRTPVRPTFSNNYNKSHPISIILAKNANGKLFCSLNNTCSFATCV